MLFVVYSSVSLLLEFGLYFVSQYKQKYHTVSKHSLQMQIGLVLTKQYMLRWSRWARTSVTGKLIVPLEWSSLLPMLKKECHFMICTAACKPSDNDSTLSRNGIAGNASGVKTCYQASHSSCVLSIQSQVRCQSLPWFGSSAWCGSMYFLSLIFKALSRFWIRYDHAMYPVKPLGVYLQKGNNVPYFSTHLISADVRSHRTK